MKLECYVFMPYEGQLRFCFDIETLKFELSDPAFDADVGVYRLVDYRPPTCREYIYAGQSYRAENFMQIIQGWVLPRLEKEAKVELNSAELLGAFRFRHGFTFTAVKKGK